MDHRSIVVSYLNLRRAIGIVAIVNPFLLVGLGYGLFQLTIQPSMSHYYYTPMRDYFVGIDFAIGVFLLSYLGYGKRDYWVSLWGGISSIVVALFPTAAVGQDGDWVAAIHAFAAINFLLALAYFCLVLFVRTDNTLLPTPEKIRRNSIYRFCGVTILLSLAAIIVYGAVPSLHQMDREYPVVLIFEVIAFVSFGISWLTKGHVISADSVCQKLADS